MDAAGEEEAGNISKVYWSVQRAPDPDSLPQLQDFIERGRAGAEGQDG